MDKLTAVSMRDSTRAELAKVRALKEAGKLPFTPAEKRVRDAAPELVEALRAALEQEAGNRPADGEPMPWEVQASALLDRVRGEA